MRAVEIKEHGGPEVLQVVDVDAPEPGPGQVSVDVSFAGINFADLKARETGYRVPSLPFRPGLEVSGHVRALGVGVTGLTVGQEVAALTAGGGYAEVALADAATVFPVPSGIDLRTAATLPTVLPTSYALIHSVGRVQPGERVLVQGAAGGIGTVAGQLAKAAGATVLGVVSSAGKAGFAKEHGGYDEVFVGDFEKAVRESTDGRGVDLALDPVGGDAFHASLSALAPFGRLVSFGNASGAAAWSVGQPELFPYGVTVGGFSILTLAQTVPDELRALTERAFAKVAEGKVTLPVTAEFELEEAAEAHRLMGARTSTGKLLLRVAG
ncbi:zinc-binding dehydrogenase [Streptomyces sp. S.PB5]|uniref:quinone oxidoreductase family protein n=1 Tax=Streptomyces sp. S.PB5 TaxID=3020844 RepID=UPI0025AEDE42|nr:zinc-binding dehydrogenase [Streptomyces sp. S.PB5]MDN3028852.1 zinc-binding dehydrogenase [Streptomyces sp. S.PB5]